IRVKTRKNSSQAAELCWKAKRGCRIDSNRGSVRGGGLYISRKMDGDQEAIRPVVGKLVAVPLKGFMLVLPHAEAVVGLGAPVFQVVHDDFLVGIIALDLLQSAFALAIAHLVIPDTPFRVYVPAKRPPLPRL